MCKQCYFQAKLYSKIFISVKLTCSCRFSLRGNLDFLDFIKKGFITSNIGLTQVSNHSTGIEISGLRQSSGGKRTEVDFGANKTCFRDVESIIGIYFNCRDLHKPKTTQNAIKASFARAL